MAVSPARTHRRIRRWAAAAAPRTSYDHSGGWDGGGPHPTAALLVLSHRPAPANAERQTFVTTGLADAIGPSCPRRA